ncbi:MAG: aldehyde dehydrogenase [Gammaproteobacteria bacterium]|nr:aldehyde dehydrogenase [Gammaproteobacteria bacterium]
MREITSIIGGSKTTAASVADQIKIENPRDESINGVLFEANAAEVDTAVAAARKAFDEGPWPRMSVAERQAILRAVGAHLAKHGDELAELECDDAGLPMHEVRNRHVPRMQQNFEYASSLIAMDTGHALEQIDNYLTVISHEPAGVAALLAPWNAPLALASMKLAQAVSLGNTAVLKPSEYTPSSLFRFVELIHEAGMPDGVVNLVNGRGTVTGRALTEHAGVDRIAFTGGTGTGRMIMTAAAQNLTPVMLELGGKSANMIFESADLDSAIDGALLGIYSNNGQQCLAGSRILVQKNIAADFIDRFAERTGKIRVGDPRDPSTDIGPLCYREHFERVSCFAEAAKADGEQLVCGGGPDQAHERGFYFSPTAFVAKSNKSRIAREEIFGPFATILTFDTVDEAIRLANDSEFGLVAYAWTQDIHTALRVRDEVRAGTVWINTPLMRDLHAPFGGYKHSGVGRTGGFEGLHFFAETKSSSFAKNPLSMHKLGAE